MTGFGNSVCQCQGKNYSVDIKSINSKSLDLSIKLPNEFKDKELEVRNMVATCLERGKIDVVVAVDGVSVPLFELDTNIVQAHYQEIRQMADKMHINISDEAILSSVLKMGDVMVQKKDDADDDLWQTIAASIQNTCSLVDKNRISEGITLEADFTQRIQLINKYVDEIETLETNRVDLVKDKLIKQLSSLEQDYDKNRFEQELIFYLEKFDFTEEKVRLRKHCSYFIETMAQAACGKKLAFISQEIGREINTLGSKASDADIQRLVVQMKDELEKIKEQLANVL